MDEIYEIISRNFGVKRDMFSDCEIVTDGKYNAIKYKIKKKQ